MRRELEPWLTGRRIVKAELLALPGPKYVGLERAAGQRVLSVGRRGKFIVIPLSQGNELIVHLGMTGSVQPGSADGEPQTHVRARLHLDGDGPSVIDFRDARRFGRFLVVEAGDYSGLPTLAALGPEPFDEALTPEVFARNLARSDTAIKTYLLSQRPIAGVGNIYADEALWRARIHPATPASRVKKEQAGELLAALRQVLEASIQAKGTTLRDYRRVSGEEGQFFSRLAVYGKAGKLCQRCGTTLEKSVVGQRGTVHCPVCQKKPRASRKKAAGSGGEGRPTNGR